MDVSVIIPCFNSGAYLQEAVDSVTMKKVNVSHELIIVDDGSTDASTIRLLTRLETEGFKIIYQENGGPAAARNTGVKASTGAFILFLDSDNKIDPAYMERAVAIMHADSKVGVVYAQPSFFGDTSRQQFTTGPFDAIKLLRENYIDMCAVVRREMWDQCGGLDESRLLIGHEDWEFWINGLVHKWKFYYLDKIMYSYRLRPDSLITTSCDQAAYRKKVTYIYTKHIKNSLLKKIASKRTAIGFYVTLIKIEKILFLNLILRRYQ